MEKELKEVSEKEKRASTQILDLQKKEHLLEVEREKILADRKSAVSQSLPSSSTQPQTVKSPQSSKSQSVQVAKVSQPIQNPPSAAPLTPNPVQSPVVTSTAPPSKSNQNSVPVSNPVQSQSIRPAQTQPAQIQTPKPTQIQTPKSVQSLQPISTSSSFQTQCGCSSVRSCSLVPGSTPSSQWRGRFTQTATT